MLYHTSAIESDEFAISPVARASSCSRTQYKVQNKRDHGEHKQKVDQPSGHVKYGEASDPSNQQNHE
jgi:hypothetical protein